MLATASQKGTLIHVFSVPDGEKLHTLRRGSAQASIMSLAFSPEECNPRLLAALGNHGTIHIFKLTTTHLTKSALNFTVCLESVLSRTVLSHVTSAAAGMLTAVTSLPFDNMV